MEAIQLCCEPVLHLSFHVYTQMEKIVQLDRARTSEDQARSFGFSFLGGAGTRFPAVVCDVDLGGPADVSGKVHEYSATMCTPDKLTAVTCVYSATPLKGHLWIKDSGLPNQDTWPSPNFIYICIIRPLKWGHLRHVSLAQGYLY